MCESPQNYEDDSSKGSPGLRVRVSAQAGVGNKSMEPPNEIALKGVLWKKKGRHSQEGDNKCHHSKNLQKVAHCLLFVHSNSVSLLTRPLHL